MSKNLFNIEQEYFEILEQIEEAEGVLTPELEEALKVNEEELHTKLQAYIYYIKQLNGDVATIEGEIERLNGKIKSLNNTKDRLTENIKQALLLFGQDGKSGNKTLKVGTHTIYNVYKKPVKLDIDDKDFARIYKGTNFVNSKEVLTPNKTAIKEHLLTQEEYIKYINSLVTIENQDDFENLIEHNNTIYEEYIESGLTLEEYYSETVSIRLQPNPLQYILRDAYIDHAQNHIVIK